MAALIYVGIERFHEIEEEDSDDLVNTDYISGKELETLGMVKGRLSSPSIWERIFSVVLKPLSVGS